MGLATPSRKTNSREATTVTARHSACNMPTSMSNAASLEPHISEEWQTLLDANLADVFRFVSFNAAEAYGPHSHQRIEINFVKRGTCKLLLEAGSEVQFREGEMMIITPNVHHRFVAGDSGCTLMQLEFRSQMLSALGVTANLSSWLNDYDFLVNNHAPVIKIVGNAQIERTVLLIIQELEHKAQHYRQMVIMHYSELLILLKRFISNPFLGISGNELLRNAIDFMRTHYSEPVNISDVARHCGTGERNLRRLFAKHLGKSPLAYLNQLRIAAATDLLYNANLSVKEVCYRCGFQSPQYFSRLYRHYTGKSPHK